MRLATSAPDATTTWNAMGTRCRAVVVGVGAERSAHAAGQAVAHLEARWSRFLPGSDVSRLNAAAGRPVRVARDTLDLVVDAIAWWHATDGLFDPTVLGALVAAGYDRDHAVGHGPIRPGTPSPGCDGIWVDPVARSVQLPAGIGIDLGGIGKGRAADLVAASFRHLPGGLIDLGGDLRVWGTPPDGAPGWPIAIEDPRDATVAALLGLADGAVATSSTLRRCWHDGDRSAHHLIDPSTGCPAESDLVSVTVVAGTVTGAEVLAKVALISGSLGSARGLLERHGVAGLLVPSRGAAVAVGGFAALCWTSPGGGG